MYKNTIVCFSCSNKSNCYQDKHKMIHNHEFMGFLGNLVDTHLSCKQDSAHSCEDYNWKCREI